MPGVSKKRVRRASPEMDIEQDFGIRLKRAKEQLSLLREQEELLDRERRELEGLKIQTEELDSDKKEIRVKLTSAIGRLTEEEEEIRKKQQDIADVRKEFEGLVGEINLVEKKGQRLEDVPQKMAIERDVVDKAKEAFERARKRLDLSEEPEMIEDEDEELEYAHPAIGLAEGFRVGLGFFLAGILLGAIVYVLFLMFR